MLFEFALCILVFKNDPGQSSSIFGHRTIPKLLTITLTPRNGVEDDLYVLLPAKNVFWIVSSHFEFQTSNHSYLLSHITTNFDVLILKELLGGRREATFYWQFMTELSITKPKMFRTKNMYKTNSWKKYDLGYFWKTVSKHSFGNFSCLRNRSNMWNNWILLPVGHLQYSVLYKHNLW